MCEPTSIAMATMAIASAAVSYDTAQKQSKAQEWQYEQNKENTVTSLQNTYKQNALQAQQQSESAAQQIEEVTRQNMRDTSTAFVAGGESGASGISVDRVLRDIGANGAREVTSIETNRDWSLNQINQSNMAAQSQAEGRINSVTSGSSVSAVPFLIQAGQGVASAYGTQQMLSK